MTGLSLQRSALACGELSSGRGVSNDIISVWHTRPIERSGYCKKNSKNKFDRDILDFWSSALPAATCSQGTWSGLS